MNKIKVLLSVALCLFFAGQAYAIATYDATSVVTVEFNWGWTTVNDNIINPGDFPDVEEPFTDHTGEAEAHWHRHTSAHTDPSYELQADSDVNGFAGDLTGTLDGFSQASATTVKSATFNFIDATNLMITLVTNSVSGTPDTTLSGESAGISGYTDVLLDTGSILDDFINGSFTSNLTGTHTVTLIAHAEGFAEAIYNSVPEPSTILLLGFGLAGVGLLRRRFKS